jgi:hypothetical protein
VLKIWVFFHIHCSDSLFALTHFLVSDPNLMNDFRDALSFVLLVEVGLVSISRVENGKLLHSLSVLNQVIDTFHHREGIFFEPRQLKLGLINLVQSVSGNNFFMTMEIDSEWNIKDISPIFNKPFRSLYVLIFNKISFLLSSHNHS